MRAFQKLATTLFLFALLVPLAASAAGSKPGAIHKPVKAERVSASLGSRIWALAFGIWTKEGLGIDPSGSPISAPGSGSQTNAGLGIDPDGNTGS